MSDDETTQRVRVPMLRPRVIDLGAAYELLVAKPLESEPEPMRRRTDEEITRPVRVRVSDLSRY